MASSTPSTILLKAEDSNRERREDGMANGTITPGDLVERDSINTSGAKDKYETTRFSTDDSVTAPLVALEFARTGMGIDADYSDGDQMEYWVARPGDQLYMWVAGGNNLSSSSNANISVGDLLGSGANGDNGALRSGVSAGSEMFEALEAVDNSSSGSKARIRVEAI